jgi:trafficking protein particle complex subunit 6
VTLRRRHPRILASRCWRHTGRPHRCSRPSPPPPRGQALELLALEYHAYLFRTHDESLTGSEDLFLKLEATGFEVGKRFCQRAHRDMERLTGQLEVVKFVCRVFWTEVFRKGVDRLQTNNEGVYMLADADFRWLKFVSGARGEDSKALALKYTVFPCGLIRGALAAFDMDATVTADVTAAPKVTFRVSILPVLPPGSTGVAAAAVAAASGAGM